MNNGPLVPDSDLDFDADLVCTLDGLPFTGTAFEESPVLGRSEITYRDGVQEGVARDWYPSGTLKGESEFVQGALHGVVREFRPDGMLAEESRYEYGIRILRRTFAADGSAVTTEKLDEGGDEADLLQRLRRELGWPS
ncbi:hypothetical protein DSM26151_15330 [Agromyces marinus]|uniref:MORN repeat variant n=1 Tax=Agromyces marinus TaxID=1389020 RepID=A0ABM8GXB1_9MICO|nr:hypothetical protein DSM26151_15330 [Agromyces marinus]BDZ53054.1 hypothetical protein GCM10025870_01270 [Agromyces marinus]